MFAGGACHKEKPRCRVYAARAPPATVGTHQATGKGRAPTQTRVGVWGHRVCMSPIRRPQPEFKCPRHQESGRGHSSTHKEQGADGNAYRRPPPCTPYGKSHAYTLGTV